MIVPMKKVFMVVQTKDKEPALDALREIGVVHLENFNYSSPEMEETAAVLNRLTEAHMFLSGFKPKKETAGPPLAEEGEEALQKVLQVKDSIQELNDRISALDKEIIRLQEWGDFDPADFEFLASKGYFVKIYLATAKQEESIKELEGEVVVLHQSGGYTAFAHITKEDVKLAEYDEFVLPAQGLDDLIKEKEALKARIEELKKQATDYYNLRPVLQSYRENLESRLEYVSAKVNVVEEETLTAIVGFVPEDQVDNLRKWAGENAIALAVTEPAEDDNIPTLIRNPQWLEVVRPVFKFLSLVPGYRELDISLFFLFYFTIFFAMIVSDAAYGVIFVIAGLLAWRSLEKKGKDTVVAKFLVLMGSATVVWGAITGSWFGSPALIQGTFLEKLVVTPLTEGFDFYTPTGEFYKRLTGQDVIMLLCFIIGLTQLTIAQVWNFLREIANRSLKAVAQAAWIFVNFGLFYLVLDMVMYFNLDQALGTGGMIGKVSLYLILGGMVLVLFFSSQEGNFVKGILSGLGGLLPTVLNAVSAFGDIISYVRLFAVGLAGFEIANSFNTMVSSMDNVIVSSIILIVAHTFNFVLCCLGVLVHGIRLNMLEFSGRLGLEWTGQEYTPFKTRNGGIDVTLEEKQKKVNTTGNLQFNTNK